ncbi:MAG: hypothetical protein AMXMBFR82_43170 [Candidatus Hydrogenedentota bacterium]
MRLLPIALTPMLAAGAAFCAHAESLSGTVTYADGSPAGGAVVYALDGRKPFTVNNNSVMVGESVPRALTDREGRFAFVENIVGAVCLLVQDMQDVVAVVDLQGTNQPLAITMESPARGEVRVYRGSSPSPRENLTLVRNTPVPYLRFVYTGKSNADGLLRLPALSPGDYTVTTWEDVPQVGCCFRSVITRSKQVSLPSNTNTIVELGGTELPRVSGTVASTEGEPLHGVWVRLLPKGADSRDRNAIVHSAVTEHDGSYSVFDVPPGDYEVRCFRRLALNDGGRTLESISELNVAPAINEVQFNVAIDLAPFMPLEAGQPAPDITSTTLDGHPFALAGQKGKYVVIHFYAGWCKPCVDTIDSFDRLTPELGGTSDVVVLGISLDESEQEARDFAQQKGLAHPVIYAGSWSVNPIRKDYRVVNVPTTVIVGPDGAIAQIDLHGNVLLDYLRKRLASAS